MICWTILRELVSDEDSSDYESDKTSYREKVIKRMVHFRESAEQIRDMMDRLCELPGGRNTWRYLKLLKLVLEWQER